MTYTLDQIRAAVEKHGSKEAAARALDIPSSTLKSRLARAKPEASDSPIILPDFPDEDAPIESVIDLMTKRFEKRKTSHDAHTWFPIKVRENRPIGIMWFGDPHVDDNGCNWLALNRHVELCRDTDGLYGANIGDTTNNWAGRLIKLYANQDTSVKTARRLAQWFMLESGVPWLIWLLGNHDTWGDGAEILAQMAKRLGTQKVVMHEWEARFSLDFPNGESVRIFAAHDMPGNSMWNPLHGPVKQAMFGSGIDLLVTGHKHNWAISQWEMAEQGSVPLMIRARGYKFLDEYARRIGKFDQEEGCSILTVFDPNASSKAGRVTAFADVEAGVDFLIWKRSKA